MNVVIVHGSNSKDKENIIKYNLPPQNKRDWIGWIKKKLEEKNIEIFTPLMPKNWAPVYEEWKRELEKLSIDEDSILIGHSSGGAFLVRWLGETKKKIKKLILLAPAWSQETIPKNETKTSYDFYNFKIDEIIKNRIEELVIFVSDNETEIIRKSVEVYCKTLEVFPITLKGMGHFTGTSMGTNEFPELLEEVLK